MLDCDEWGNQRSHRVFICRVGPAALCMTQWAKPPHGVRLLCDYIILFVEASRTLAPHEVCWDHKLALPFFLFAQKQFAKYLPSCFACEFLTRSLIKDMNKMSKWFWPNPSSCFCSVINIMFQLGFVTAAGCLSCLKPVRDITGTQL